MSNPTTLRAIAVALRHLHEREPQRRCDHLARWADEEAARLEEIRRGLEWWPAPREGE